jgi:benzoyl-CoA reductase/2-hydroxyglutaryl-CoA dehydratase subunit BcrC/BadD/HgdB
MSAAASPLRQACAARQAEELAALRAGRAAGARVAGSTCQAFPAAVLAGLGYRPVRLLCGATAEAQSLGEREVRADVCPHVKCLLGNVREGRGLHGEVDLWIGLSTCDPMRRGLGLLSSALGRVVYPLHLPATRTAEAQEYYAQQIATLVNDLAERAGHTFDPGAALAWQHAHDRAAGVLSRAARAGRLSPLDLHALFQLLFVARPEGLAAFFEAVVAAAPPYAAAHQVVLTGSPVALEDTLLLEELEARRIGVVPLNCTGLNAVEDGAPAIDTGDVVRDLALRAFRRPPCARARPNRVVHERIGETLRETRAAGLIVKCLTFCDLWYTERERLRGAFGVPALVFDSDCGAGGRERLLSRIDAFVEMLEQNR